MYDSPCTPNRAKTYLENAFFFEVFAGFEVRLYDFEVRFEYTPLLVNIMLPASKNGNFPILVNRPSQ
jgi:hypothetical protein